jgi:hypothetical protein
VNDGAVHPSYRLESALDERLSGLHQYLDSHVARDQMALDELAAEIKISLRRRGKSNLDFPESDINQLTKQASFASRIHRLNQRLVAVP